MRIAQIVACALLISGTAYASDKKINEQLVADMKALQPKPRAALEDWLSSCYEAYLGKSCNDATRKWFALYGEKQSKPDKNSVNGLMTMFASALNSYQFQSELKRLSPSADAPNSDSIERLVGVMRSNYRESLK